MLWIWNQNWSCLCLRSPYSSIFSWRSCCREFGEDRRHLIPNQTPDQYARLFLDATDIMAGPTVDRIGRLLGSVVSNGQNLTSGFERCLGKRSSRLHPRIAEVRKKAKREAELKSRLEKKGLRLRQSSRLCRSPPPFPPLQLLCLTSLDVSFTRLLTPQYSHCPEGR